MVDFADGGIAWLCQQKAKVHRQRSRRRQTDGGEPFQDHCRGLLKDAWNAAGFSRQGEEGTEADADDPWTIRRTRVFPVCASAAQATIAGNPTGAFGTRQKCGLGTRGPQVLL